MFSSDESLLKKMGDPLVGSYGLGQALAAAAADGDIIPVALMQLGVSRCCVTKLFFATCALNSINTPSSTMQERKVV